MHGACRLHHTAPWPCPRGRATWIAHTRAPSASHGVRGACVAHTHAHVDWQLPWTPLTHRLRTHDAGAIVRLIGETVLGLTRPGTVFSYDFKMRRCTAVRVRGIVLVRVRVLVLGLVLVLKD